MERFFDNIVNILREHKIENPRLEARIVFGEVLGIDYAVICGREEVSFEQKKQIEGFINKRITGWPLDKIIGKKAFYKYDFVVNENVLSPRPETEILVEEAIKLIKDNNFKNVLDLGTGSGCIILSILADCPEISGLAIDISEKALKIAQKNADMLAVKDRIKFLQKSWSDEDFSEAFGQAFDLIVSNPPYIPQKDKSNLMREVRDFDPSEALFGGEDGLDEYKNIAKKVPQILRRGGYVLLEIGINQTEDVRNIFEKSGFLWVKTLNDLSGIERCIVFKI